MLYFAVKENLQKPALYYIFLYSNKKEPYIAAMDWYESTVSFSLSWINYKKYCRLKQNVKFERKMYDKDAEANIF